MVNETESLTDLQTQNEPQEEAESVEKKISRAKEALLRHSDTYPGAIGVFTDMLLRNISGNFVVHEGMVRGAFTLIPEEDIQILLDAIDAVKAERKRILKEPPENG